MSAGESLLVRRRFALYYEAELLQSLPVRRCRAIAVAGKKDCCDSSVWLSSRSVDVT